ncbi:hypothetical protein LTR99_010409 [Exophiala xenobiotica]|uniref:Uncharacterized protein n=1 Tax=Vermiconidia calcicola TaxID=1690605 RepID=A0AAV9Q5V9_9PEZI|nr:hypothetical protein LTS06_010175 [Exophiala xenobiotica]KAK5530272.1 hypothetical protein LTR23_010430 [Chaetothyriales sp. CCFEE 6169]KAK5534126.1 hypothetical protein LTR25_007106 [Vermiconidia calcicola]KAK5264119.1 hypothetical protein LTR96_010627 [Exophiala xenobiotica]KAK5282633.1 hypothetical protein LTR40_003029 [Exophiala xenobiotica]
MPSSHLPQDRNLAAALAILVLSTVFFKPMSSALRQLNLADNEFFQWKPWLSYVFQEAIMESVEQQFDMARKTLAFAFVVMEFVVAIAVWNIWCTFVGLVYSNRTTPMGRSQNSPNVNGSPQATRPLLGQAYTPPDTSPAIRSRSTYRPPPVKSIASTSTTNLPGSLQPASASSSSSTGVAPGANANSSSRLRPRPQV